jgi:hypothetical protein
MAITYTWKVSNLDTIPTLTIDNTAYTDVIKTVHWRLHGTDGTHTGEVYGSTDLDTSAVGSGSFVTFDQLTPGTIAGWAALVMKAGEEGAVDRLKASVAARIDALANPPVVSKMPEGMGTEVADSEVVV